jgi:hypothetical protein
MQRKGRLPKVDPLAPPGRCCLHTPDWPAAYVGNDRDQTSMLESPAQGNCSTYRARNAEPPDRFVAPYTEPTPSAHAMGAIDTESRATHLYGCSGPQLYNRGRPHFRLGPGIPDRRTAPPYRAHRHCLEEEERVTSTSILGGLHHEYVLERTAA